jgi:hypothetical protein
MHGDIKELEESIIMTDPHQLIAEMARVWADGGGTVDGFTWCSRHIRSAIAAEIKRRKNENQSESK